MKEEHKSAECQRWHGEEVNGNILPFHMLFVSLPVILKNPGHADVGGHLHLTFEGAVFFFSPWGVYILGFCLLGRT